MPEIDTFNRWLIGAAYGGRAVKMLAPPSAMDTLTPDEALLMAAYLLLASGRGYDGLRPVVDAVEQA